MIKLYFKQAWNLIRQEKLFSSIYIIGTGLSITIVMVLSIVYYIRTANIYPETNRDRMLIVKSGTVKEKNNGWTNSSALSSHLIETCIRPVNDIEAISAIFFNWEDNYVQPDGSKEQLPITVKYVDSEFWYVFPFRFLNGQPFTQADFQSGMYTAVIAESLARKLFGTTEVVGKHISMNFRSFRVCGVVKDASYVTETTYAQLWIPYTTLPDYQNAFGEGNCLGNLRAYILAKNAGDIKKIKKEILTNIEKYNLTLDANYELSLNGQPDRYWQTTFRQWSNVEVDFTNVLIQHGIILFILLLVPAISLSGMTDSRMERRLAEMGIRRAFGAPVKTLMSQIISENLLFTLLGGIAGLLLSYLLILISADWIMEIGKTFVEVSPDGISVKITPSMLLNIPVFIITLTVCLLLNLLTALIPAWRSSHKEIIYSLNN